MSAIGHEITLTSPLKVQDVTKNGAFFGYAVTGCRVKLTPEIGNPDTDTYTLKETGITITPIHYELTCHKELDRLKSLSFAHEGSGLHI
ncbi:MAG: hypothetical protein B1H11_11615 [Desulfobacteraceae bacterium 4484_190.1]|nr:MAG: hypothetical protein B1H11_11615 [Desulfobacteraceae bacterium 4484_190.1]